MPETPERPRLAVVADDPLSRRGLAALVDSLTTLHLVTAAAAADLAAVRLDHDPDVLLWDLGGLPWTPPDASRDLPVVVLTEDAEQARWALSDGALGALRRDVDGPRLLAATLGALAGLTVLDPALESLLAPPPPRAGDDLLTPREAEVLGLLAEGRSNRDVGLALGISEHTARFHVQALLGKLEADNRTDAVVRAIRLGWLTL